MNHRYDLLVELGFVGGSVMIFAVWQLVSINREIARDKQASDDRARHPVGEHRLDDG